MLHRSAISSIHLSFNLAAVLPRMTNALAPQATPQGHNLHHIVYGVDYQGIESCLLPTLSHLSVSLRPGGRLRHRYSSRFLRISPLHLILPPSTRLKLASIRCSSQVEPGISHLTQQTACASPSRPVIPMNACTLRITPAAGTELAGGSSAVC